MFWSEREATSWKDRSSDTLLTFWPLWAGGRKKLQCLSYFRGKLVPRSNCPSPTSTLLLARVKKPPNSLHPHLPHYYSLIPLSLEAIRIKLFISVYINYHKKPKTLGSFLMPMCLCPFTFLSRSLASLPLLSLGFCYPHPLVWTFPSSFCLDWNQAFHFLTPFSSAFSCNLLSWWLFFFPYPSYL